jgi:hypothetical protein
LSAIGMSRQRRQSAFSADGVPTSVNLAELVP